MKNILHYSPSESKRFDMKIYRGTLDEVSSGTLRKQILRDEIDLAIVRIDASSAQLSKVFQLGFPVIQADTLVYYHTDFSTYTPKPLRNSDLTFSVMTPDDVGLANELVSVIFTQYTNHYNANVYLDKRDILAGYQEWVAGYIDTAHSDKICYKVQKKGEVVGFATVAIEGEVGEGVLYGVLPEFSGMGIYSDIIRFTQSEVLSLGCTRMKVSTQVQNYAVQKVWSREGFVLQESFATLHINAMLSYSIKDKDSFTLTTSNDEIQAFAAMSGDYNPIHLDDSLALQKGFDRRIAHGLTPNAALSRYYSTVFPDQTSLFLRYNYLFNGPVYPDVSYSVEIGIVHHTLENDIYESVAKIKDESGQVVIVAYTTLKAS